LWRHVARAIGFALCRGGSALFVVLAFIAGSSPMASPTAEAPKRPLSPHLGIYRWQWTMTLSILHRITGLGLALGTLLLVYWLWAAASGQETFFHANAIVGSWIGRLLLFGWTLALFYHLFNGIRHLFWDAGKGFELRTGWLSGMAVVAATLAATLVAWIAGYMAR
jgi:succinate dehydrogenase / fumarate reductase cytochrome b subunit